MYPLLWCSKCNCSSVDSLAAISDTPVVVQGVVMYVNVYVFLYYFSQ